MARPILLAFALLALGLPAADASAKKAKKPSRLWYQLSLTYDDRARTEYRDVRPAPDRIAHLVDNQRVSWHAESSGSVLLRKHSDGLRIAAGDFAGRLTRNEGSSQADFVNGDGTPNCTFNNRRRLIEKPRFAGTNFSLETETGVFGMNVGPPGGLPGEIQYLATACGVCSGTSGGGRPLVRRSATRPAPTAMPRNAPRRRWGPTSSSLIRRSPGTGRSTFPVRSGRPRSPSCSRRREWTRTLSKEAGPTPTSRRPPPSASR